MRKYVREDEPGYPSNERDLSEAAWLILGAIVILVELACGAVLGWVLAVWRNCGE
jgi:hypothetical protein